MSAKKSPPVQFEVDANGRQSWFHAPVGYDPDNHVYMIFLPTSAGPITVMQAPVGPPRQRLGQTRVVEFEPCPDGCHAEAKEKEARDAS